MKVLVLTYDEREWATLTESVELVYGITYDTPNEYAGLVKNLAAYWLIMLVMADDYGEPKPAVYPQDVAREDRISRRLREVLETSTGGAISVGSRKH